MRRSGRPSWRNTPPCVRRAKGLEAEYSLRMRPISGADAELPGKWVLKGEPALVEFTSPKYGEKASYY